VSDPVLMAVQDSWDWTGVAAEAVTATSAFGHLIVRDAVGAFWYLDPELRAFERVAADEAGLFAHMKQHEVREIWEAEALVGVAAERLGAPGPGECYSLVPRALIAGDYAHENLWIVPVAELIRFTGDFEQQTRHLSSGTPISFKVVD